MKALVILLLASATAAAQTAASCPACDRGKQLIDKLGVQEIHQIKSELAMASPVPLSAKDYERFVKLRAQRPVLRKLGAASDEELADIAAAICGEARGACVEGTTHSLRCLADRCAVAFPRDDEPIDIARASGTCQPEKRTRTQPLGVGFDIGSGWQASRYPVDGRTWSLGVDARLRLFGPLGFVARFDRTKGRDEALDGDGDGDDDNDTGAVTRFAALAGPSITFDRRRMEGERRFLRLDLLGGYLSTRSQADESGPAAGVDLSFNLEFIRIGGRFVQGFGDARDSSTLLAYFGFLAGATPNYPDETGCGPSTSRTSKSRFAIGFAIPIVGIASKELGVLAPSYGFQAAWFLNRKFDAIARADMLYFPGYERDRVLHQSLLAGLRIDDGDYDETGVVASVTAGYNHAAGAEDQTGPIGDVGIGFGFQMGDGAAILQLHSRFGLTGDNEYFAIFLSSTLELRLDEDTWDDR